MTPKLADLHIHTTYSDSTLTPQEVIVQATTHQLSCIAITDHDTVAGIAPTIEAAKNTSIEVLAGIELSSLAGKRDVHMLGYLFDPENIQLRKVLDDLQENRRERMRHMVQKLIDLGVKDISYEEVAALAPGGSVGRVHLAQTLLRKGKVGSYKAAFDRYLAEGKKAYVKKDSPSPIEAIKLIKDAGGIAVLAHPMVTNVDELIPSMVKAGLDGLEVHYPNSSENIVHFYSQLAKKYNLLMTGGSDGHGDAKKNTWIGRMKLDYSIVEAMKQRRDSR